MDGPSFLQSSVEGILPSPVAGNDLIFITTPPIQDKLTLRPFPTQLREYHVRGFAIGPSKSIEYTLEIAAKRSIKRWAQLRGINEESVSEVCQKMLDGDVIYRYIFTGND